MHTNNREKLYCDLKSNTKPSAASGNININVVIFTIFSDVCSVKKRLVIIYSNCPPSSDKTGSRLKTPTDRFDIAKGRKISLLNKYNR